MKTIYSLLLLFFAGSLIAAEPTKAESVNIGSGFIVKKTVTNDGQIRQLFYGKNKLGQIGNYSISPSGHYAAFQDAPAGNIYLYRVDDNHIEQLTRDFIAPTRQYSWDETLEILRVEFTNNAKPMSFAIE